MKASQRDRELYIGHNELMAYYKDIALNIYKWDGLPKNIKPFYPEDILYDNGMAVMIELPGTNGEYDIFPVAYGSEDMDLHGFPRQWRATVVGASPGAELIRNRVYTAEDSVLIWNNPTRTGLAKYVDTQVMNMLMADFTLRTNLMVQNTPVLIKANEKNNLTAKNMFRMFNYEPVIFKSSDLGNEESIEVIDLGVQFIGKELSDQYETFNNRILRYLGINHLPVEKQERMLTGETEANDELIDIIIESRIATRRQACEQMKDVFGLTVSVDSFANQQKQKNLEQVQKMNGGDDNGPNIQPRNSD